MSPLELQKQLLIAESELNRAQALQEWQAMTDQVHVLAGRARTIGSLTFATASVYAGLVAFMRRKSAPAAKRPSWWHTILTSMQLAGPLWSEFRSRRRRRDHI